MKEPLHLEVPRYIQTLAPYVPGTPIEEVQRRFKLRSVIKIASNENPLGPSPRAMRAVQKAARELHRYPDGSGHALKQALSKLLKTRSDSIVLGNGSNEIIDLLVRTFCVAGDAIVTSRVAFIAYKLCAQIHGVETIETELTSDLRFDLRAMLEAIRANPKVRLVFIANPNNPTGTYVTANELNAFLREVSALTERTVLVALDYAYWEYVTAKDLPDPMELLKAFPNVVVMRTFSKIYGLAGLRMGYGVAAPEIVAMLEKVRQPFNANSLGMVGAQAALGDTAFVKKARSVNTQGLKFWEKSLDRLGIPYWKSQGNFILADVQAGLGLSGPQVYEACLAKGVIFRPIANYGMPGMLRISVGTPKENARALQVLSALKPKAVSRQPSRSRQVGQEAFR